MGFLSSLDISGSAITAQKKRMDVISENVANRETTRTENGGPYRRKLTVFREITGTDNFAGKLRLMQDRHKSQNAGVMVSEVIEDQSDFIPVYDPNHADANEEGYVMMPNVNQTVEMIDAMAASRSYSANISMFDAMKNIANMAIRMGRK